jgi:[ribosomal protein S18]-alanine N-acetyltransferase
MKTAPTAPGVAAIRIATAAPGDLDRIMAIERASFAAPWTTESIAEEIARPWSIFRVLRDGDDHLCAYLNFWVVYDELHVLNIATSPENRRNGYARALMVQLLDEAHRNAVTKIVLEVRRTNHGAQGLYESLGFVHIGVRPKYYGDSGEDAIVYALELEANSE